MEVSQDSGRRSVRSRIFGLFKSSKTQAKQQQTLSAQTGSSGTTNATQAEYHEFDLEDFGIEAIEPLHDPLPEEAASQSKRKRVRTTGVCNNINFLIVSMRCQYDIVTDIYF